KFQGNRGKWRFLARLRQTRNDDSRGGQTRAPRRPGRAGGGCVSGPAGGLGYRDWGFAGIQSGRFCEAGDSLFLRGPADGAALTDEKEKVSETGGSYRSGVAFLAAGEAESERQNA